MIEKAEALGNFSHYTSGNLLFALVELDLRHGFHGAAYGQSGEVGDGHAVNLHAEALGAETLAATLWTRRGGHVVEQPFAICITGGFLDGLLMESQDAAEAGAAADVLRAIEQRVLLFGRQLLEWLIDVDAVLFAEAANHGLQIGGAGAGSEAA